MLGSPLDSFRVYPPPHRNIMPFRFKLYCWLLAACSAGLFLPRDAAGQAGEDWISVGGDRGCSRYSTLDQINRDNVGELQIAWTFRTGELVGGKGRTIECTPVVVDGVAYVTTANRRVVALDGQTGQVVWDFDPASYGPPAGPFASGGVNRGVAYWTDEKDGGRRRIL